MIGVAAGLFAPLVAVGAYQYILSGDPVAAATVDSSSASSGTTSLECGTHAEGIVFASDLEAFYRSWDESPARSLRSDDPRGIIISVW